ncbi:hypothetical protein NW754_007896 [Fusarium falciforme]|nr:hypothetical protein NW754_007896 [Fusarium falciforme]
MHHIISDGWSVDILRQELGQFYSAALRGRDPLSQVKPLPIQYRDFAAWQKEAAQVAEHERQLAYWENQLADSTPGELLTDFPRPQVLSGKAGVIPVTIEGPVYERLLKFSKERQVTLFSVLLAAFRATHYRLTGAEDATIGTPIANRNRPELEHIIGFFVNSQCMRLLLDTSSTFESLVQHVRSVATDAYSNQDIPFERIVSALLPGSRDASRSPLIQLMFALHSQPDLGNITLEGLEHERLPTSVATRFDMEFHLFQEPNKLSGSILFADELFQPETINSVVTVFQEILRRGLDQPQVSISTMPLTDGLIDLEKLGLLEIESTNFPRDCSVVDVFRQQVAANPDAPAVVDSETSMSYTSLDQKSDQIAAWLHAQGLRPESLICVMAPRSCETIVSLFGILKAGYAYLPLDVNAPAARIQSILFEVERKRLVLLGSGTDMPQSDRMDVETARIQDILTNTKVEISDPIGRPLAASLAYVIFTSGSTGRPKGVMIEHRSILRLVKQSNVTSRLPQDLRMAHISNLAFDASIWEIFTAILNGGALICIDYFTLLDSHALRTTFEKARVNATLFAPALLKECLNHAPTLFEGLEVLYIGGDRLDATDAAKIQALVKGTVYNAYGPTENTVMSTIYSLTDEESYANGVPIGNAVSNSGAYIMDQEQRLVPPGVMGELVVSGDGLARGYTNSILNAGRFVDIVINDQKARAYRTGDRTRCRPKDGSIEFFGRMDQQVKIRGHRVEPAEVEQAMLGNKAIRDAAVVVVPAVDGQETEMIGFVSMASDRSSEEEQEATNQVQEWEDHFESTAYTGIEAIDQATLGRDFTSWTSMYNGNLIDKTEMEEWLDDTMQSLLDKEDPGRVLEIGTGTGMVLFNLPKDDGLKSYVGIEPSRSAVLFVEKAAQDFPGLQGKTQILVGTAEDIKLVKDFHPDVVVINSVAQYFPSRNYLAQIASELIHMTSVRTIFFGDMRSWATNRDFLVSRALYTLGDKATKDQIRREVARLEENEDELLVDPAFFTSLTSQWPSKVKHVEILPKRMRTSNELSSYRYAAVLHICRDGEGRNRHDRRVHSVEENAWIDFASSGMDRHALVQMLDERRDAKAVAIGNIPHSNTINERHFTTSLDTEGEGIAEDSLDGSAWQSATKAMAARCPCLSVTELVEIGQAAGFRVEVSWARQRSQHGALDVVFHHLEDDRAGRVLINFPTDFERLSPSTSLTSRPLQRIQNRRFESQIREQLQTLLPPYMVPPRILVLERMPLNANGKVDRKELARKARTLQTIKPSAMRVAPRNDIEAILCDEFQAVLGVAVGVMDNFFELGGHSLMATKLAARLSRRFDTRISVKDIFNQPILQDLANVVQTGSAPHEAIPSTPYSGPVEQSFSQGRLWFLDQLNLNASWYHMPLASRLRGPLRIEALQSALATIEARHESLRTTFEEQDGVPVQIVHAARNKHLRIIDVSGTEDAYLPALKQEQDAAFDLTAEPGWRVALLRLGPDDHVLSIVMHHIISDGWSVDILRQELGHLYSNASSQPAPLPIQYRDFAIWQKQESQIVEHQKQLNYWKRQLVNSKPAELLADFTRPKALSGDADVIPIEIDDQVYQNLRSFCRARQVTSFVALLAAFRAAHYRLTGAEDATIGSPIANRNRPELEGLIGCFVNTQCLRIPVKSEDTFDTLVKQAREAATEAQDNQDVPFERIVSSMVASSRDTSRNPLVQVMFAVHSQHDLGNIRLEGVEGEPVSMAASTRFDAEMHLFEDQGMLGGNVVFSKDLFESETIRSVVAVFQETLRRGLANPHANLATLPLTDGLPSLRSLCPQVDQPDYPRDASMIDVFREQVASMPKSIAVIDASSQLTYAELDERSSQLATWLRRQDIVPEELVGVLAPRSCEAIIAFLGILKANLAYLPLDVNAPAGRIETILSSLPGNRLILLGSDTEALKLHANGGVMVEHRGIARLVKNSNVVAKQPAAAAIAHLSNLAFDASTWEIYAPLLNGGTVVCIDYYTTVDIKALEAAFNHHHIRGAMLPPALLKQCLVSAPTMISSLEILFAAGDRLSSQDAVLAQHAVGSGLYNAYGPTENTVLSTIHNIGENEAFANGVPIGNAVSNSGAFIMDQNQQQVSAGVMGELVVTGDGLARGYIDSKLEVDRFIYITLDGNQVRAYRTGDRVRYRPKDGKIEFFGRMDQQIKIRGHRIEPAEVEQALARDPAISDSAVITQLTGEEEPELVAFFSLKGNANGTNGVNGVGDPDKMDDEQHALLMESKIRHNLQALLPTYMIPSRIIHVDQLPVNANGKVDRNELAVRAQATPRTSSVSTYVAPRNDVETIICEEFADILSVRVGITDNFFDLGGHSLIATKLAARLSRRLDTRVSVREVFDTPVVGQLAASIQQGSTPHEAIPALSHSEPVQQSFAQGRLWFLDRFNLNAAWYIMPFGVRLRGPLRVDALQTALRALEERHELLRTTFEEQDGVGMQIVHPPRIRDICVIDISGADDDLAKLKEEQQVPFNLSTDVAWRVALFKAGDNHHILSIVMHHIISDGWSVDIFQQELAQFYSAAVRGHDPLSQVNPLPIRYRDFAVWQRQDKQVAVHESQLQYWTEQLADSTPAEILTDFNRPKVLSGEAGTVPIVIEDEVYEKLSLFCRNHHVTSFVVLLAAFRVAHYRLTGAEDATIGTPIANRNRPELEDLIGFFVNTQCMRIALEEHDNFLSVVQRVRSTAASAFENQDVPFERLVSALLPGSRDASRNPLVQLMFVVHSQRNLGKLQLEGLEGEPTPITTTTRFDGLAGNVIFAADLFEAATIRSVVDVFHEILRRGLDQPDIAISTMPLVDGLAALNSRDLPAAEDIEPDFAAEASVVDVFQAQVVANPDALAVTDTSTKLTYAELDQQSDHVAAWLSKQKLPAESMVVVLAPRSSETIVACIGILKANLAYLPMDFNVPEARRQATLSEISGEKFVLLGAGVPIPDNKTADVRMVLISDIIATKTDKSYLPSTRPSASSLAYVIFTSGSTGRPKGVMVEHRGVLSLVKQNASRIPQSLRMAHVSNLAFDASVWEIFTTLLNGGTLFCISYFTVLDSKALCDAFTDHRINMALLPPALLKQCLADAPSVLSSLEALYIGGDRLDGADATKVKDLVKGKAYNAYGPTENSVMSTIYTIEHETFANGVPIGTSLGPKCRAYIMDQDQQLVPAGVMGELVVAGDGLARGYTDPSLNTGRFIHITIDGRQVRAYRTGDRVRYRPRDYQIEFFGRLDQQIKIRGHRIEPAEVEQALLSDSSINDAVVVSAQNKEGLEMVGYITAQAAQSVDKEEASNKVQEWEAHFDSTAYANIGAIDRDALGQDFLSWTSMNGSATLCTHSLDNQPPGRVLEIGTGTGMVLFNLGRVEGLQSYAGLEPSRSVTAWVNKAIETFPSLAGSARVHVGTAEDVSSINGLRADLVVINSVAQYFPSREYLAELTANLIQLPGVKRIFFGDMRTYATNKDFLVARAVHTLGSNASKAMVRQQVAKLEDDEEELLVDPAFFTSLNDQFPDEIKHVEILPKRMAATNELSSYRYAAVIHVGGHEMPNGEDEDKQWAVKDIDPKAWVDFAGTRMDRQALLQLLQDRQRGDDVVAVSNIPYSKTIMERHLSQSLDDDEDGTSDADGTAWISATQSRAKECPALSVADLIEIGKGIGFQVETSWARQHSQRGGLDAVFHRFEKPRHSGHVMFRFPTEHKGRSPSSLTNRPLHLVQSRRLEAKVRERLQSLLPSYMIPSRIMLLDQMPLTSNGKVDRKKLARQARVIPTIAASTLDFVAPRTEIEVVLCEEFTDLLGVKVGITDNFFELGGHSLLATKLSARLSRRLDAGVTVKQVFDQPVLADLAASIRQGSSRHRPIPSLPYEGPVEQSFAQGRLWFLDQFNIDALWYLMPLALRIRGPLQVGALAAALVALEDRHESLRTTFEERDGVGIQVVQPLRMTKDIRIIDVSGMRDNNAYLEPLQKEQQTPFDLASEPGWRVALLKLGKDDHILSIVMHHIISDGWSTEVLQKELSQFYSAAKSGKAPLSQVAPLPIQYRDFSVWQRQEEQVAESQRQLDYWKKQLADSSPAELLADYTRPSVLSGEAGSVSFVINDSVYKNLLSFCRSRQVTTFATLLAAFRAAHYRMTGSDDATIGTPIANRNRPELENLIGCFVNTQCMRITIGDDETFESLVQQVRSTTATAFENQDVPFERIVSALSAGSRDTSRNPLVQLLFAVHSQQGLGRIQLDGVVDEPVPSTASTRFDLEFHAFQEADRLNGSVMFATDLFQPETIQGFVAVVEEVLQRGLEQPQSPIATMPLAEGIAQLRDAGALQTPKSDYPRNASLVDVFQEQAAASSSTVAVTDSTSKLTYAELDRLSDQAASYLRRQQLPAETMVAVLAPRSCETIIAFLAILKANLAYMPLDVNTPSARMEAILSSVPGRSRLILVGSGVRHADVKVPNAKTMLISDVVTGTDAIGTPEPPVVRPGATSLAYVIFTSGSTGKPKGVKVEHRAIMRLVKGSNVVAHMPPATRMAHLTNIAFDVSLFEMCATLLNGGTLVCIDYLTLLDMTMLRETFEREQVRAAIFPPALLQQCLINMPDAIGMLEAVYVAGDRFHSRDAHATQALAGPRVYNAYGPTENAILSTIYHIDKHDPYVNGVPIGSAVSNSGAYVMDRNQQLLPPGVMGELVVTGEGIARGYTDSSLDTDRFITVTIDGQRQRAYRTGDRVRYRPKGFQIEFFGRLDQQAKIRGHRVELGEVEHALLSQKSVTDAAVVLRTMEEQDPQLVAFVTTDYKYRSGSSNEEEEDPYATQAASDMRKRLQSLLPYYMVPSRITILRQMPLNVNGKVDRKDLARRAQITPTASSSGPVHVAPRNETEAAICDEFETILGTKVGITDNFFELGGHSLMATKLAARLSRRMGLRISVKDLFDDPVPVSLAGKLEQQQRFSEEDDESSAVGIVPFQLLPTEMSRDIIQRDVVPQIENGHSTPLDMYPATQTQIFFLHDKATGHPPTPPLFSLDFPENADCRRLASACAALVQHFDIFRTVFVSRGGRFYQVVLAHLDVPVEAIETEQELDEAALALHEADKQQPLRLGLAMLRIAILKRPGAKVRLVLRMSHALYDGLSLEHIVNALHALYSGKHLAQAPKFGLYMHHMASRRAEGYNFWRSILQGSSMTSLKRSAGALEAMTPSAAGTWQTSKSIRIPPSALKNGITQATLFTAAVSLLLAKHTKSRDVVFGRVVSGRQDLSANCQDMVGPCINEVPVRVRIDEGDGMDGLLRAIQDQYTSSFRHETLGFQEVKENCTDWPDATNEFGCCIAFQNLNLHPEAEVEGQQIRLEGLPAKPAQDQARQANGHGTNGKNGKNGTIDTHANGTNGSNGVNSRDSNVVSAAGDQPPVHDLDIVGMPEPNGSVMIGIGASRQIFGDKVVGSMLNDLCETMLALSRT